MELEKNIAAILKREMERRGMTFMEFSTELGIPRSTLQGYMKGTSHPRADSMETLADKLGISLTELICGEDYIHGAGFSQLNSILAELPALHPRALPIAKDAVDLLRSAFQLSNDLYDLKNADTMSANPEWKYRYLLHELQDPSNCAPSYGILAKEQFPDGWATVAIIAAFSHDKTAVSNLAERCTALQLSPEHLMDVVQDFLGETALDS